MLLSQDWKGLRHYWWGDALIKAKYPLARVRRRLHATHRVTKASIVGKIPRFGVKGHESSIGGMAKHALSNGILLSARRI